MTTIMPWWVNLTPKNFERAVAAGEIPEEEVEEAIAAGFAVPFWIPFFNMAVKPFSPLDLSPDLWLDAAFSYTDAGVTLATNGQAVQQANDQSGNNRHASQATPEKRPLYIENGVNGLAVLRFDGVDDVLSGTATVNAARTVFLVAKKTSAVGASSQTVLSQGTTNSQVFTNSSIGSGWSYYLNQSTGVSVHLGGTPTSFTIVELAYASASSLTPTINGSAGSAFDPNNDYFADNTTRLGSGLGGNFGDYDIAELLVVGRLLLSSEQVAMRQYLASKYGITVA